ncbi:hypothetical protein INR75_11380 [Zunongwangia sp. SCSIO 43204]|uniref:hypothetical protein n=1 Tax=Zunongwangia sp. SCSIO 43204 TaxID=2779359 RepID=UPI001CAA2FAE|nr:hypothetical protein [Zunongwangia sp. SCSIO 43204]UAB82836.1 hypothetical protein INR75_11380 [Zunongwangia sp. SCSIO 43204]
MEKLNGASIGDLIVGVVFDDIALRIDSFYKLLNHDYIKKAIVKFLDPKADHDYCNLYFVDHRYVMIGNIFDYYILSYERPKPEFIEKIKSGKENGYYGNVNFVILDEAWNIEGLNCIKLNYQKIEDDLVDQGFQSDDIFWYCIKYISNKV